MDKILVHKECIVDLCNNEAISVRGENPYCREHVKNKCELNSTKNIFNESRCNSTVQMINCCGKVYCNSHYRTMIFKCNNKACNKVRKNNKLSFDKKWYCKKHTKKQNHDFLANLFYVFKNRIPGEITENIFKIHLKNNEYIL